MTPAELRTAVESVLASGEVERMPGYDVQLVPDVAEIEAYANGTPVPAGGHRMTSTSGRSVLLNAEGSL